MDLSRRWREENGSHFTGLLVTTTATPTPRRFIVHRELLWMLLATFMLPICRTMRLEKYHPKETFPPWREARRRTPQLETRDQSRAGILAGSRVVEAVKAT